jgi:hypothetical protein
MMPRWLAGSSDVGPVGNWPVGRYRLGSSTRLPGQVVYACPLGAVHVIVALGCCKSRQPLGPPQKVLSK